MVICLEQGADWYWSLFPSVDLAVFLRILFLFVISPDGVDECAI